MSTEYWWNDTDSTKPTYSEKDPSLIHFPIPHELTWDRAQAFGAKVHESSTKSTGTAMYEQSPVAVIELQSGWGKITETVIWMKNVVAEKLQYYMFIEHMFILRHCQHSTELRFLQKMLHLVQSFAQFFKHGKRPYFTAIQNNPYKTLFKRFQK
jgi:hypothetical protein